jgi:membrane-associated phospholipid phosphatase
MLTFSKFASPKRRYFSCVKLAYAVSAAAVCLALTSARAYADTPDHKAALFASGDGNIIYLAAGVGLPLLSDGRYGTRHALRVADALGTSVLLSEALKNLTHEKRPDSNSHDSFPSGHATAAFAVATVESDFHPHQAAYWYLGATLISLSRVRLRRHTTGDVVAGAVLGAGTARVEVDQPRGLILSPFIMRGGLGMMMSKGL